MASRSWLLAAGSWPSVIQPESVRSSFFSFSSFFRFPFVSEYFAFTRDRQTDSTFNFIHRQTKHRQFNKKIEGDTTYLMENLLPNSPTLFQAFKALVKVKDGLVRDDHGACNLNGKLEFQLNTSQQRSIAPWIWRGGQGS